MKSDFRTSSRGWPRPLLCWAPSTLLLLTTLTTLLLNTEYSSAVISSKAVVDNSWIKLDKNFPPTYDSIAKKPVSRFYYARGRFSTRFHLVNKTMFAGQGITMLNLKFDVWRNIMNGTCAKGLRITNGQFSKADPNSDSDQVTRDGEWFHFNEQYTEEEFRDFNLWTYATEGCENSLVAIKDLSVTYNSYYQTTDKVVPQTEAFKQLSPDLALANAKNQYLLEKCDVTACTMKIKLDSDADLKVHFWSSKEGDKLTATGIKEEVIASAKQIVSLDLKQNVDLKKDTDSKTHLTISVKTSDNNTISFVQIGEDNTRKYTSDDPVGSWEPVDGTPFGQFISKHKGAQVMFHKAKATTAKIGDEDTASKLRNACYKVFYFAETVPNGETFTIFVDSHAGDLIQRYPLATFKAMLDKEESFDFCVNDYIHDLTKVFSSAGKVQLYIMGETLDNSLRPRKVAIKWDKNPTDKPVDTPLKFIREEMKANEKWSSIVSGVQTEIKADNSPIVIGAQQQPQLVQIFSKWLVSDNTNPNLNALPVVIQVTTTGKTIEELKQEYKLEATICDEIMECISVRQTEKLDSTDKHKATYELEFDAHPNRDSHHLKLRLSVNLPKDVGVSIELKSFGDPCFEKFMDTEKNNRCPDMFSVSCTAKDPAVVEANSKLACECDSGTVRPFCIEDYCASAQPVQGKHPCGDVTKCRNTLDDYECICPDNKDNLEVWKKGETCKALASSKTDYNSQDMSWTMDVSEVNPKDYDICYKFTTPETKVKNPIVFDFSLVYEYKSADKKIQTKANLLNEKFTVAPGPGVELVNFCFSQLMENYGTTEGKLKATIKLQSAEKSIPFAKTNSHLYSIANPPPTTAKLLDHLDLSFTIPANFFNLNTVPNKIQQITFRKDFHQGQTAIFFSQWINIPPNQHMKKEENNLNSIKVASGGLSSAILICPPRNSAQPVCVLYNNNLGDALSQLSSTKFQVVYTLTAPSELKAEDLNKIPVTSEVSLWNACKMKSINEKCPTGTTCQPDGPNQLAFACKNCPAGTSGTYCEIQARCDQEYEQECAKQHSSCVQFTNKTYHCLCPMGYDPDESHHKCLRKSVKPNIKFCSPDRPDSECFLTSITSELFSRLPKHFPVIDANDPQLKTENLYYAFRKASQLTVTVDDKDRPWQKAEEDVCIKFGYYVSRESTLVLTFTEPEHPADHLELVSLRSPLSYVETDTEVGAAASKLAVTEVCIKALLPIGKLTNLEKFNLTFFADVPSGEGAVVVELKPYETSLSHSLIGGQNRLVNDERIPTKGLRFLSRTTSDLGEQKEDKTPYDSFKYQWPVLLPTNPDQSSRWEVLSTGSVAFKGSPDTKLTEETVIIESAWVNRLLRRSNTPVYLSFKLALLNEFTSTSNFNLQIVLIDANSRKPIGQIEPMKDEDFASKEMLPIQNTHSKEKTFFILINQFEVPFEQLFKIQFRVYLRNMKDPTTEPSFKISEISFGDPCIRRIPATNAAPLKADLMDCKGLVNNKHKVDPKVKCLRLPQPSGTVDFQCNCTDKTSLTGKKCEHADFCKLTTEFDVKNRQNPVIQPGDKYCAEKKSDIKCRNGKIGLHDFTCLCPNNKEKFNFETQLCEPIPDCTFKTCDFSSQVCEQKETGKPATCDCKTKYGFFKANENDTCHEQDWNKALCDPHQMCGAEEGSVMQCLWGVDDAYRCVCPKGYKFTRISADKTTCTPDMCPFKGAHFCQHFCVNTEKAPDYFECTCDDDYTAEKNAQTNVTECKLKETSPCKDWSGQYKICTDGKKDCVKGFTPSTDGTACVPVAAFKLEPACPGGAVRFDENAKEYVCDCSNATLTGGYFTLDNSNKMPGTCELKQSICDVGQPGRTFCSARGAGCLVDPNNLHDFSCTCQLGRLFPDGSHEKPVKELRAKSEATCVDVCDLPYRKSLCASIGAQCNTRKLWQEYIKLGNINKANEQNFCECVSGTFSQKDEATATVNCVQEPKVLNLALTLQWSDNLQGKLDKKVFDSFSIKYTPKIDDAKPTALQLVDPVSFARAEFRAMLQNRVEAASLIAAWTEELRGSLLQAAAAELLYTFDLAENPVKNAAADTGTVYDFADQIHQNVQLVSVKEAKVEGVLAYTVHVAVKINDRLKADEERSEEEEEGLQDDQLEADAATTAAAGTTSAPITTTAAPAQRDRTLPPGVVHFNELMASCIKLGAEDCIIPYLDDPRILRHADALQPVLHEPCTTTDVEGVQACHGMSNCRPLNGSTFECLCGEGFDVEMSYTFKSRDGLVVHKNEYCKAQDLCTSNCLDGDKTHTKCKHIAPSRASVTSPWVNSYSCDCVDKYVPQGANNGTCTYVCATLNCGGGDHGECVPAAKSASCRCKEGFYGEHCQHTVGSNTWWIVGIVVLGVLALAAIGAAVFFWRSSDSTKSTNHTRSSSPPNNSQNQTLVTDNSSRQAANIRRITAKADLTSVEQYEGTAAATAAETSTENHHHLPTEPEHSQHSYQIISHNQHQITTVESTHQQKSAPPESNLSSEPGLEPGQLNLQKTSPDQDSTTTTSTSSSSSSSTEENNSQNRFSSNTARSSFVSAGDLDSVLSRQTSINSLTVHEPFTPYNASPRSTAMYGGGGGARRSIVVPIIEENERELHKSRFSHSTNRSSSTSSSSSSESSSEEEKKVKIEEIPSGPPEPGNAVFTTAIKKEEEDTSSSSSSSSLELPTEPSSTSLAGPPEPSTKNLQPQQQQQPNQDLLRDSQEMDSAKFQHVRARIAAVLKLNSNRTYKVSQPSSPEVGRR